jgi:hypothetical protein
MHVDRKKIKILGLLLLNTMEIFFKIIIPVIGKVLGNRHQDVLLLKSKSGDKYLPEG